MYSLTVTNYEDSNYQNSVKEIPQETSLTDKRDTFINGTCSIRDKIFFLKTSKTGSTSVANILMRFGLKRQENGYPLLYFRAETGK